MPVYARTCSIWMRLRVYIALSCVLNLYKPSASALGDNSKLPLLFISMSKQPRGFGDKGTTDLDFDYTSAEKA